MTTANVDGIETTTTGDWTVTVQRADRIEGVPYTVTAYGPGMGEVGRSTPVWRWDVADMPARMGREVEHERGGAHHTARRWEGVRLADVVAALGEPHDVGVAAWSDMVDIIHHGPGDAFADEAEA
jgi:hypothetical protein